MSPERVSKIGNSISQDLGMDEFYDVFGEFYSSDVKRHKSPTKRLIKQKNSTVEHKEAFRNSHT